MKRRAVRAWWMGAALFGCLLASPPAAANGRYPYAQLLLTDPSNPDRLWLRATYGVLTSTDRGCTWHWLCEQALGYRGEADPMLGVMADGSVIGGIFDGLVTSRDSGCSWSFDGPLEGLNVEDLAVDKRDPARAIVLSTNGDSDGRFLSRLWQTTDSARTWVQLGPALADDALVFTLDAAPSEPNRIYVTGRRYGASDGGFTSGDGLLFRSDDTGKTWQTKLIPGGPEEFAPYLSAVHPNDPQKIYVRLRGKDDDSAVTNRVIYSPDGGESWQQIFEARADVLGFALSPDGRRIALGLGDPRTPGRAVDDSVLGLYLASTQDHRFAPKRAGHVGCLTWSNDGLYFCSTGLVGVDPFPNSV